MKLFIACATLLSLANGQYLTVDCDIIIMGSTLIDPEVSDTDQTSFACVLDSIDAGGVSNLSYPLELSVHQAEVMMNMVNDGDIVSGSTMLSSPASLQTNFQGGKIIVPNVSDPLSVRTSTRAKNREGPCHEGNKPILAVRVTDKNGLVQSDSPRTISDKIFGTYDDDVNLASQMNACSFKKLTISTDYNDIITVEPGVIEVTIPISITENDRYTIHNAVTVVVQEQLGFTLPGPFDQVMYVIQKCYVGCGYAAYAYVNSWMSVYQDWYYKATGVQMHEIGHNFGFAHSGGLDGQTYTDHTCLMGNPLYSDEIGKMCFNPAKSWQIGWYDDSVSILDITQSSVAHVQTIIGVANYGNNGAGMDVVIKLETGTSTDYFVGFNRATGINGQNDEADDEVTIIETGNNGEAYSQSFLKATLRQGESYTVGVQEVLVTVESIDISTDPGTARISFKKGTSQPTLMQTETPTTKPTKSPVKDPFNCDVTKYLLQVKIQNDDVSTLKYVVQRKNRRKWAKRKDMNSIVKTTTPHEEVKCVPRKLCYRFKIIDRKQRDGLKTGGYKIIYNDELIKDSKFEKVGAEWLKFGEGCGM